LGTKSRIATYTPETSRSIPTYTVTEESEIISTPAVIESTEVASVRTEELEVVSTNSKKYEIIVGAFAVSDNAKRMVRELKKKGFNASLSSKKGNLQLVSSGSVDNYETALQELDQAKTEISSSSWLKEN
jgi:cell division septation protein DedD